MRDAGFYWVRITEIVCDGGGIIDESWGEPQIARFDGHRSWFVTGEQGYVADQLAVEVLSPKLDAPSPAAKPPDSE